MDYQNTYAAAPASNDGCLDWDSEIQQESSWELLPEGDYPFTVEKVERGRFSPKQGSKIPACNMAIVTFNVGGQTLTENFPLHTKMEWKISALYAAVGMKQQGEKVRMNWPGIVGRSGYVHVGVREWKKDDGSTGQSNEFKKFYAPWDKEYAALSNAPTQPQYISTQQPAPQPQQYAQPQPAPQPYQPQQQTMYSAAPGHWTPGQF